MEVKQGTRKEIIRAALNMWQKASVGRDLAEKSYIRIKNLYDKADRTDTDWNKVVLIPVSVSYDTSSGATELISVNNDMSMTSTRLVRGNNDTKDSKITISVIYSKFK